MDGYLKLNYKDFALINYNNNFLFLQFDNSSRYFGLLLPNNDYYMKVIDKIENERFKDKKVEEIYLMDENKIKVIYENGEEEYELYNHKLVYRTDKTSRIKLFLDIRHIYDVDEWGRIYSYDIKDGKVNIYFNKGDINFKLYVSGFNKVYENEEKWLKVYYKYDEYRKSPPFERYLYVPFTFEASEIKIIFSDNPEIKYKEERLNKEKLIRSRLLSFVKNNKISAGFPWYFQEWTRDVLISLPAFYLIGKKDIVKNKLIEYSNYFLSDGRLRNITNQNIGNSDSFGLFVKRLFEFRELFSDEEFNQLVNIIIKNLENFEENYFDKRYNLFLAYPNETWMDTLVRNYPIELQFLMLNVYERLYEYTKDNKYKEKLEKIKLSIKLYYLSDFSLYDDLNTKTIRCNIFLSYYYYPNVFSKFEWEKIFDYALNHLYLYWGGVSSISKMDKRFIPESNEDNYFNNNGKSMHNGDSWIFINNITAMALYDVNKDKYQRYIEKIIEADEEYINDIGTLPERSSAIKRSINGAIHQLWSIATYLELFKTINKI